MTYLQFLLLGLGSGAVIAALALGVLLTYRASGVINFAHAALGMYIAYTYVGLRQRGELLIPIIGLPGRVQIFPSDVKPTWATAFAITMVVAALLGLVIYALVFRPLREAPTVAKVVASLGLFLYLLGITDQRLGSQGAALAKPEAILPSTVIEVAGVQIPADRLWLLGLVAVATAVLAVVFQRTRFGLATRAAAESEKGAVLLGHSPVRLAAINWMIASMLAGAAVIFIAPIARARPRHHQPVDRAGPGRRPAGRVPLVRADHRCGPGHRHGPVRDPEPAHRVELDPRARLAGGAAPSDHHRDHGGAR